MTRNQAQQTRLRVAHLNPRKPTPFLLEPDADQRADLATRLELLDLPRLRFEGSLKATGTDSWDLDAHLTARTVQACVVTLAAVKTVIDEDIHRRFAPEVAQPEGEEIEMLDDEIEPLGQFIDLNEVMAEALALALPLYPRAEGAELAKAPTTPEVDDPDTRRPFEGLADLLRNKKS